MKKYSIIDIETTGGRSGDHKITEIAIINLDGEEVVAEYSTLINPERNIPFGITRLTGISNDMVLGAPKFYEIAKKIVEMTEGRIFVAHNVYFDFNFIKSEFADLGFSFKRDKLCTVRLARRYLPGHKSYSLGKICQDLNINISARHRALGDASATVELFKLIQNKIEDSDLVFENRQKLLMPPLLNPKEYENLPSRCGVYYFFNKDNELLYIGKSKDIKKRVSSHFRVNLKRRKDLELKAQIARIEYRIINHELAALLYECLEIKRLRPTYNVARKGLRFPLALTLEKSKDGILEIKRTQNDEYSNYFHTFRNKNTLNKSLNKFYTAIVGVEKDSIHFDKKFELLLKVLGKEKYNNLVQKVFLSKLPKDENKELMLTSKIRLTISDRRPKYLFIDNERIEFPPDQDLFNIMSSYLIKL